MARSNRHAVRFTRRQARRSSKDALLAMLKESRTITSLICDLGAATRMKATSSRRSSICAARRSCFPITPVKAIRTCCLRRSTSREGQKSEATAALENCSCDTTKRMRCACEACAVRIDMGDRKGAVEALKQSFYISRSTPACTSLRAASILSWEIPQRRFGVPGPDSSRATRSGRSPLRSCALA